MANLSLLRLLLLLNIVSSSKLMSSFFDSPWSLIQLSLGPLWGLTRLFLTQKQLLYDYPHLKKTLDGIEAFWDLGCCLLYLCLKILICLNAKNSLFKSSTSKVDLRITLQPRRPMWRLVSDDGYLLSISASLASRGCMLVLPSKYLALVLPIILFLDLRTKLVQDFCCFVKNKNEDLSSIYVTRTSKTTSISSSLTSNAEPFQRYIELFKFLFRIVTFS